MPNRNAKILDLGCGKGHHSAILTKLGYCNVTGVDLHKTTGEGDIYNSETLGSHWQNDLWSSFERKIGINFEFYNGKTIPFKNEVFDAVVLYAVIEHVDNAQEFLKECSRVLKSKGKVFVYRCPNKYSYSENLAKLLKLPYHKTLLLFHQNVHLEFSLL